GRYHGTDGETRSASAGRRSHPALLLAIAAVAHIAPATGTVAGLVDEQQLAAVAELEAVAIVAAQQRGRRPGRREELAEELAGIPSPTPAVTAHRGDQAAPRGGPRQHLVEGREVARAGAHALRLGSKQAGEHGAKLPHAQQRMAGGVGGVDKVDAGNAGCIVGHITTIIQFDGYVYSRSAASSRSRASSCSASIGV